MCCGLAALPGTSFQPSGVREDNFKEKFLGGFWKESESVSSWIDLTVIFMSVLDKESSRKYLPINV